MERNLPAQNHISDQISDHKSPRWFTPSRLRRITTSGSYIPEIDGLRLVAILSVLIYHAPILVDMCTPEEFNASSLWQLTSNGSRGVELFFLISGFILGLPFAAHSLTGAKRVSLPRYFLRRITRLEPPYILAILLRVLLLSLVLHRPFAAVMTHGLATLFYLHGLIFGTESTVSLPAWSLEVEIQFYCLAPLLAWAWFALRPVWLRRTIGCLFILAAGVLQLHFLPQLETGRAGLSILNYVQYFFSGFLLCDLYLIGWKRIPEHWTWDMISAAAWCWIFVADGSQVRIFLPLVALIAYIGAFKGVLFRWFFRLPWISLLGGMCYSIYLTHNTSLTGVNFLLQKTLDSPALNPLQRVVLGYTASILASFAGGFVLYIFVERPCMDKNWPMKLWNRFRNNQSPSPDPTVAA